MAENFQEWAILELMGHRKMAGLVQEVAIGGASFIRIDVPAKEPGKFTATQFYNPSAVYCMTPVAEDLARQVAQTYEAAPVSRYELPPQQSPRITRDNDSSMEPEDYDDDAEVPV
jgi:hypothetical protein